MPQTTLQRAWNQVLDVPDNDPEIIEVDSFPGTSADTSHVIANRTGTPLEDNEIDEIITPMMANLGIDLEVWDEHENNLPIEQELTDQDIMDTARGQDNLDDLDDQSDDEVTVVRATQDRETVAEQLTYWRSAAAKMEMSPVGSEEGLLQILNMIQRIESQQHRMAVKQSKVTDYFGNMC